MTDFSQSTGYIDRVAAWFGIGDLDFRLTRTDRRRLLFASGVPILLLLADLIRLLLQAFKHIPYSSDPFDFERTTTWWHLYFFVTSIQEILVPLSIALLFVYAIYPVTRTQASLALLIVVVFVNLAIGLGLATAILRTVHDRGFDPSDFWYLPHMSQFAYNVAYLAIGYAFFAFRGLSRTRLPSPRRVRIPPSQPREL